jgi:hypothetical protein
MLTHLGGLTAAIIHMDPTMPDEQAGQVEPVADGIRLIHARPAGAMATASGLDGWSESVRAVLGLSRTLHARAVVLLNADITSMTPAWIRGLAAPVLKERLRLRAAYLRAGTLRGHPDPALRGAAGPRALSATSSGIPWPTSSAVHAETAEFLLAQDIWTTDLARQGLEFWLPIGVAGGALPVAPVGTRPTRTHSTGPAAAPRLHGGRVAGSLFSIAERHEAGWLDVRGSEPVAVFGVPPGAAKRVAAVDPQRMIEGFRQGVRDLLPIWERILSPESLGDVLVLSEQSTGEFRLHRLAVGAHCPTISSSRIGPGSCTGATSPSLSPLFTSDARPRSCWRTRDRPDAAVAHAVERMARTFEAGEALSRGPWR